jgi:UDP-N-acetyl-D-galactosamine dehydrogenase
MGVNICVVGLGYVGLPLAVAFSKVFSVTGFDVNEKRVNELNNGIDSNCEISKEELLKAKIRYSSDASVISLCNFIIIAVPTPITKNKKPDLSYLEDASRIVGLNLSKGAIVVYESTVYPGVTEEVCLPILEKCSKLKCGIDFKIGYSPERINPGDKKHTVDKVVKIVSGMDSDSLGKIASVYSSITTVFKAVDIKTAEAAKVIENIQRDLNIALMNELSLIFCKIGIKTKDVLDAASTKWNFHRYHPGLIGGHCIPVDPYYLTYKAEELGYHPQVILAGRRINDYMAEYIVELVIKGLNKVGKVLNGSKILVLGLTFKENVKDIRNSKIFETISKLKEYNADVYCFDPLVKPDIVENINFNDASGFDCVIYAVAHNAFSSITLDILKTKMNSHPLLIDVRNVFDSSEAVKKGFVYYSL